MRTVQPKRIANLVNIYGFEKKNIHIKKPLMHKGLWITLLYAKERCSVDIIKGRFEVRFSRRFDS